MLTTAPAAASEPKMRSTGRGGQDFTTATSSTRRSANTQTAANAAVGAALPRPSAAKKKKKKRRKKQKHCPGQLEASAEGSRSREAAWNQVALTRW